jgi:hypothetical protein
VGKNVSRGTYTEVNLHGFKQVRIYDEDNKIETYDSTSEMKQAKVLNPASEYGDITRFLAVDTEFDNLIICRVSIINDRGEIVFDTLIHQEDEDL